MPDKTYTGDLGAGSLRMGVDSADYKRATMLAPANRGGRLAHHARTAIFQSISIRRAHVHAVRRMAKRTIAHWNTPPFR